VLTKNLVRYKTYKGTITPQFISVHNQQLLSLAEQLLMLFNECKGMSKADLLEQSKEIIAHSNCHSIIAQGLEKLLIDRTQFNTDIQDELVNFRQTLFLLTGALHNEGKINDLESYYQEVSNHFQESITDIQDRLYSDLPMNQPVTEFKSLSAERLLHRYNCALVQGLLIHCENLLIHIYNPEPANVRQLFKYLRFHQLLAQISKQDNAYEIQIDGPMSLFFQTQKYGLNLALFFPAVLNQNEWQLTANIYLKNRNKNFQLNLDQSCQIQSQNRQFMAYTPDEIIRFQNSVQKKLPAWKIEPSAGLIPLVGEAYCFPDYTLIHESGVSTALELFHPWHSRPLIDRLKQLNNATGPDLILGVSKKLLKDPIISSELENSQYFQKWGFLFRDMPTVSGVQKVLAQITL